MSDLILYLPTNEYHIPNQNEINIMNTLFSTPQLPHKQILRTTLYSSVFVTFINLLYFKYLSNYIPSHIFIITSFVLFAISIYYIQIFNHDL